jgi:hypothetical protein
MTLSEARGSVYAHEAGRAIRGFNYIVHGDHGSRFSIHYPSLNNLDAMVPDDYLDCFSTLFAVKRPHLPLGRDVASRAVDELFQETLNVGDGPGAVASHTVSPPFVFFSARETAEPFRMPYPFVPQ